MDPAERTVDAIVEHPDVIVEHPDVMVAHTPVCAAAGAAVSCLDVSVLKDISPP